MLARCAAFVNISKLLCIIITTQDTRAARIFRSKDDEEVFRLQNLQRVLVLDKSAARDSNTTSLVKNQNGDDLVFLGGEKSNKDVKEAEIDRKKLKLDILETLKLKAVNSRSKRSNKQIKKSIKRRAVDNSDRNDVLVPYVPLNLYAYQHESEYVVLEEVIFEKEPKYDSEILEEEPKYDKVIRNEETKYDSVILKEEPNYDPNDDLRHIFDNIDAKFREKVEKKKKFKNSIIEKWLEILAKKRKALFWLWKKKFSPKGFKDGILYAEEIRYPKIAKNTSKHMTPSSHKHSPKISRKLVRIPEQRE